MRISHVVHSSCFTVNTWLQKHALTCPHMLVQFAVPQRKEKEEIEYRYRGLHGSQRTKSIQVNRKHGSEGRRRGAIIPLVPRKTFHLSIITCFLLRAIAAQIGNKKTHITGRENYWKDTIVSSSSYLCRVTKRLSVFFFFFLFHAGKQRNVSTLKIGVKQKWWSSVSVSSLANF